MPSVNKVYQNIQFLKFGKSTIKQLYIDFNLKLLVTQMEKIMNYQILKKILILKIL